MPKFPQIKVRLLGEDGNAFNLLGKTKLALRRGGVSDADISAFLQEAMSGDYNHVLTTIMQTVEVE